MGSPDRHTQFSFVVDSETGVADIGRTATDLFRIGRIEVVASPSHVRTIPANVGCTVSVKEGGLAVGCALPGAERFG